MPDNTPEEVKSTVVAETTALKDKVNAQLAADFYRSFAAYGSAMMGGGFLTAAQRVAPMPPNAFEVSAPDAAGHVILQRGMNPVVAIPAPVSYMGPSEALNLKPGVAKIGAQINGSSFYAADPGDTIPVGQTVEQGGYKYLRCGKENGPGAYLQVGKA